MNRNRKTVPRITARALRKLRKNVANGYVGTYFSSSENLCLRWYFGLEVPKMLLAAIRAGSAVSHGSFFLLSHKQIQELINEDSFLLLGKSEYEAT